MAGELRPLDISNLPPWVALSCYFAPTETVVKSIIPGTQVVGADPNRDILIFSTDLTDVWLSTNSNPGTHQGVRLTSTNPMLFLNRKDHGPLVNVAWFSAVTNSMLNLTVIEAAILRWPDPQQIGRLDTIDTGPRPPGRKIDATRNADGGAGILDYWLRKVAGMFGVRK